MNQEYAVSSNYDIIGTINIGGKSCREPAKLYGLVLEHSGILKKLGGEPCFAKVEPATNLDERGQHFKLWKSQDKI